MGRYGLWLWCGLLLICSFAAPRCYGQDLESPSFSFFAGGGATATSQQHLGSVQMGATFGEVVPNQWKGLVLEGGYILPWSRPGAGSALFSANYAASWQAKSMPRLLPFATIGYTRLIGTANAINYGVGLDCLLSGRKAIRVEVRDYQAFGHSQQHNVALRVGWILYLYK